MIQYREKMYVCNTGKSFFSFFHEKTNAIQKDIEFIEYIEYHGDRSNGKRRCVFISIFQYPARCKMQLVGCKSDGFTARSFSKKFLDNWYSRAYACANRMGFIWFFSMTSYTTIHDRAVKYLANTWHAWSCNINRKKLDSSCR